MQGLQLGGALARTGRCWPLLHPSHPTSVGLACRLVGAWRRHLVKHLNSTGRNSLPGDLAVWDGHVATVVGKLRLSAMFVTVGANELHPLFA
jgi:hypothetical protein